MAKIECVIDDSTDGRRKIAAKSMRQDLDDHRIALDAILRILRSHDTQKLQRLQDLVGLDLTANDIAAAVDQSISASEGLPVSSSSRVTIDALTRMSDEDTSPRLGLRSHLSLP